MSKFYNIQKALSYNPIIILAIGARSIGKTYTTLKYCLNRFIKHGKQMIYIRRYSEELKKVKPYIFNDIMTDADFSEYKVRLKGQEYQIAKKSDDGKEEFKTFCYLMSAQAYQDYKGVPYPKVENIVWDEYLRENKRPPGYLQDEVGTILSILITVARNRKSVRMFLLSNACDIVNPLFRFLHINNEPKCGYTKYALGKLKNGEKVTLLLDYPDVSAFGEQSLDTLGGAIADGTKYADLITNNTFSNAHNGFIAKKSSKAVYRYSFKFNEWLFAAWFDEKEFIYYITDKTPKDATIIALTMEDYELNMLALDTATPFLKNLRRLYTSGVIRFNSATLRENFFKMCKMLRI